MDIPAEQLVEREPWRLNLGQASSPLDPRWSGELPLCEGPIEHEYIEERTTGWWFCLSCGYCSRATTFEHYHVQHPLEYLMHSVLFFYRKRLEQGASHGVLTQQAAYVAGLALRQAAAVNPNQMRQLATKLIVDL